MAKTAEESRAQFIAESARTGKPVRGWMACGNCDGCGLFLGQPCGRCKGDGAHKVEADKAAQRRAARRHGR